MVALTWACGSSSDSITEDTAAERAGDPSRMGDAEIVHDLRRQLARMVEEDRFSGTVLFAKHGRPLFAQAYGLASRAFGAKVELDTKFNMASTAKLFTSISVLQLAGEGKLSLDDALSAVLPDYPNQDVARRVKIGQLLAMTSGLGDYVSLKMLEGNPERLRRIEDYLPFFVNDPLRFEPGTQQAYSNAGFLVLGLVVERLSGQRFEEYVRTHIFEPAEMAHSGFYAFQDDIPNLALGYTRATEPGAPLTVALRLGRGASAAGGTGTYTTVEDLLRFAQAIQAGRLLDRKYTDLLMRYSPTEMWHLNGFEQDYARGIHITGHGGATSGTSTRLSMYPDLGYTVAVLSNYDGGARLVGDRLEARLTGEPTPRAISVSEDVFQAFAGSYVDGGLQPIVISVDRRGALFVAIPLQGKHKFVPLSSDEFFDDDMLTPRLRFTRDGGGTVTGLVLSGIGREPIKASKQP
ncbi:beta-lactamase family protein [Pendulispora brunnea]|uniref:Beta-lactamase family protein n=1 Tax=Pendulispora brunnea TaxID=2905690 RepID=A0ABZ2KCC8_9BACT